MSTDHADQGHWVAALVAEDWRREAGALLGVRDAGALLCVMYTSVNDRRIITIMKRLQIYIDEDLDVALGVEARQQHTSKAALIREYVADRLRVLGPDPVDDFIASFDGGPDLSAAVDDVVYGQR